MEKSPGFGLLQQVLNGVLTAVALCSLVQLVSAALCQLVTKNVVPQFLSAVLKLPAIVEGKLGKTRAKGCTYS